MLLMNFFQAASAKQIRWFEQVVFEHQEIRWKGLPVSDGIVIGRVLRMHNGTRYVYRARIEDTDVNRELVRLHAAVELARQQLRAIKVRAEKELGRSQAYIFDAHILLLEDQKLISDVEDYISQELVNVEWAVKVVSDRLLSNYAKMKDDYLRERGSDIEDVVRRLLAALSGEKPVHRKLSEDAVIVSQDLLPSAVAELDLEHTRAIITDSGGWTSHTAILARALGIPAVVGLRDFFRCTRTGDTIIVDSTKGDIILHPTSPTLERYQLLAADFKRRRVETPQQSGPIKTVDGREVQLRANVEVPSEFEKVRQSGARGIGLYRSEFLLSKRGVTVSEEEQLVAYRSIAKLAEPYGAIVRLFDLGGEIFREPEEEAERNPALGLRAIRFALRHEEIMRTQVRAILRAAASARVDLVLPMVADVSDIRRARKIIEEEETGLQRSGIASGEIRIGAMLEVPSAILMAERIVTQVDFIELGTNDLVQYTLAVDRGNDEVSDWFRTLHPAVLYGISRSLKAAKEAGIPAIVCGEMASTPAYAVLLVGLGAVDLSMTPAAIFRVSRTISAINSVDARAIAESCLNCETADEVENLVREQFTLRWPELFPLASLPARRNSG